MAVVFLSGTFWLSVVPNYSAGGKYGVCKDKNCGVAAVVPTERDRRSRHGRRDQR